MPKGHSWPDEPPREEAEAVGSQRQRALQKPALIRRLGDLSAEALDIFGRLKATLAPLITDESGHRLKALDEMYVSVAEERWIRQIAEKNRIQPTTLRASMKSSLQKTARHPQRARIIPEVVRKAGRTDFVAASVGGLTRIELLVDGRELLTDYEMARNWARRHGLTDVPIFGSLAMNLIAPTENYFSPPVLDAAIYHVREIVPPGTVIALGPVVSYNEFFDTSGQLFPKHQSRP